MSSAQKETTFLLHGNPFRVSERFRARFDPRALPQDVGGELAIGDGGHCCVGVVPTPPLRDENAVLGAFGRMLGNKSSKQRSRSSLLPVDVQEV